MTTLHASQSFALLLASCSTLLAADWPQWRGPNGTGSAAGTLPEKPELLWKVEIPGKGVGSPIILGGRVFIQSASADGSKRMLVCFAAKDGTTAWSTEHDAKQVQHHPKGGMVGSTPAADGTSIYCVWWDGPSLSLRAYDSKSGKERWSASLGQNESQHGVHHSPAVHGGKVIVNLDQDSKAEILAFDAKTGDQAWSVERRAHGRANYTTPMLLETPDRSPELIVSNSAGIESYDPKTGKILWHHSIDWPGMALRMIGIPLFAQGLIIAQFGDGSGSRYTLAVKPGSAGDASARAPAWELRKGTPYIPGIVAKGEYLYWITDSGIAVCAEAKTGRIVWEERAFAKSVSASPILADNGLLAIAENGRVAIIKAAKTYDLVEEWDVGEQVIASPAMVEGRVYIRGAMHLFCYGKK